MSTLYNMNIGTSISYPPKVADKAKTGVIRKHWLSFIKKLKPNKKRDVGMPKPYDWPAHLERMKYELMRKRGSGKPFEGPAYTPDRVRALGIPQLYDWHDPNTCKICIGCHVDKVDHNNMLSKSPAELQWLCQLNKEIKETRLAAEKSPKRYKEFKAFEEQFEAMFQTFRTESVRFEEANRLMAELKVDIFRLHNRELAHEAEITEALFGG